jgi:hypothetical protein
MIMGMCEIKTDVLACKQAERVLKFFLIGIPKDRRRQRNTELMDRKSKERGEFCRWWGKKRRKDKDLNLVTP